MTSCWEDILRGITWQEREPEGFRGRALSRSVLLWRDCIHSDTSMNTFSRWCPHGLNTSTRPHLLKVPSPLNITTLRTKLEPLSDQPYSEHSSHERQRPWNCSRQKKTRIVTAKYRTRSWDFKTIIGTNGKIQLRSVASMVALYWCSFPDFGNCAEATQQLLL